MKINEAAEQLKKGNIRQVYLIGGAEDYLSSLALHMILENLHIEMPELNVTRHGQGGGLISSLEGLPMLSERRAVIAGLDSLDANELKKLPGYLPGMPAATVLILQKNADTKGQESEKGRGQAKMAKELETWVQKNGCVIDCATPRDAEAADYLCGHAAKRGLKFSRLDAQFLCRYTGGGLSRLIREMDKLAAACNGQITKADIQKYACKSADYNIFALHELMLQKKKKEALELVSEILEDDPNPIGLISILSSNFELMLIARACADARFRPDQIKKNIMEAGGAAEFRAEKAMEQSRLMDAQAIRGALQKLAALDFDSKQGNVNLKTDLFAILCGIYG